MNNKIQTTLNKLKDDEIARWKSDLEEQPVEFSRLSSLDFPSHIDNLFIAVPECSDKTCFPDIEFVEALTTHKQVKSVENLSDFEYLDIRFHETQTRESALTILSETLTAIYKKIAESILPKKEEQFLGELADYDEILHAGDEEITQTGTASPVKQSPSPESPHVSSKTSKTSSKNHIQTKPEAEPDFPTIS